MPSTYSPRLRLELMAFGEKKNAWGAITNTNLGTLIEDAITGRAGVVMPDSNYTLTTASGAVDEARRAILTVTGTLTSPRDLIIPNVSKTYWIHNNTNDTINVKTASGSAYAMRTGQISFVYCDGLNAVREMTNLTRLDNINKLTIGNEDNLAYSGGIVPRAQQVGTSAANTALAIGRFTNDGSAATMIFAKSRGATIGSTTTVQTGDILLQLAADAATGTDWIRSGYIRMEAIGTITATRVPGRFVVGVMDNTGNVVEPFRVSADFISLRTNALADSGVQIRADFGTEANPGFVFNGDADTGIWRAGINIMAFVTGGVEAYRITASGSLLIGANTALDFTTPTTTEGVTYNNASKSLLVSRNTGAALAVQRTGNNGDVVTFWRNPTTSPVGSISVNASATAFNTSSDYRLKDNIEDLDGFGEFIDALRPRKYVWKTNGAQDSGLIAHEAQEITKHSVTGFKDGPEMQMISYASSEIIANLIAAVKDLRQRVASLEA